jgi:hypothetical protein
MIGDVGFLISKRWQVWEWKKNKQVLLNRHKGEATWL